MSPPTPIPSSPPARAVSPGNNTEYTLDFDAMDAFMPLSPSAPHSPTSTGHSTRRGRGWEETPAGGFDTDDVDGPTDFTQNMEFWMRGGAKTDEAKKPRTAMGPPKSPPKRDIESRASLQPTVEDYAETPVRAPLCGEVNNVGAPPRIQESRGVDGTKHLPAAQLDDLYARLQQQSDLIEKLRLDAESSRAAKERAYVATTELAAMAAERDRLRRGATQAANDYATRLSRIQLEHEEQFQAKETAAQNQLDEERELWESRTKRLESEVAHLKEISEKSAIELSLLRRQHEEDRARIADLELQLQYATEVTTTGVAKSADQTEDTHANTETGATETIDLPSHQAWKAHFAALTAQLDDLKSQLAREQKPDPPASSPALTTALEEAHSARLALETETSAKKKLLAKHRRETSDLKLKYKDMLKERNAALKESQSLSTKLESQQTTHQHALDDVQLRAEQAVRRAAAVGAKSILKSTQHQPQSEDDVDIADLQARLERLTQEADAAHALAGAAAIERDAAVALAQQLRADMAQLRADVEGANAEADRRIVGALRRREAHWQAEMKRVAGERKELGRALMRAWGREEMGAGEPQPYQYWCLD